MTVVQQCQDCRIAQLGFLLPDDPETKAYAFSMSLWLSARSSEDCVFISLNPAKPIFKEILASSLFYAVPRNQELSYLTPLHLL